MMMNVTEESTLISSDVYWKACEKYDKEKNSLDEKNDKQVVCAETKDMMTTTDAGRKSEFVAAEQVMAWGYKIRLGSGKEIADFDILIDGEEIKVECKKSELWRKKPNHVGRYQFGGIQNTSVATIGMFITPEGIRCKVANTSRLCHWASKFFTYGESRGGKDGYAINFHAGTLRNVNERGLEIFLPFTKENLKKCIKE
jgi:hypothetical protein